MSPVVVYRRQELMRDICRACGYQGRFVWLVPTTQVVTYATNHHGGSRIRYRELDIEHEQLVRRFAPYEGKRFRVPPDRVICALPVLRNRRRDMLVFMNPATVRAHSPWSQANQNRLAPEEIAVLLKQDGFDHATLDVAQAVCTYRQLVDPRGRLTSQGEKLLKAKKLL